MYDEHYELEDYQSGVPRWCTGCGDNAILAAVQRLCRDEELRPEKTVFVSGIGCSSRFPHYMKTYGFHGIHGRALPVAEGVKMARPDLTVFVNTGDGDCCSIGAAHWIHAIRYNMNMTVFLHDNQIYGLTKKQASPTSPIGTKSNTTPRGSYLEALNPLTVTLGVQNVSFVAQAVDWIPELLYDIVKAAYHHKGLSFVRIVQRCPEWLPKLFDPWMHDPNRSPAAAPRRRPAAQRRPAPRSTRTSCEHDPSNINRAREIASRTATRSRWASCTATRRCPATRTCGAPTSCARPNWTRARPQGGTGQVHGLAAGRRAAQGGLTRRTPQPHTNSRLTTTWKPTLKHTLHFS